MIVTSRPFVSICATDRPVLGVGVGGEVAGEAADLTVQQLEPVCCYRQHSEGWALGKIINMTQLQRRARKMTCLGSSTYCVGSLHACMYVFCLVEWSI